MASSVGGVNVLSGQYPWSSTILIYMGRPFSDIRLPTVPIDRNPKYDCTRSSTCVPRRNSNVTSYKLGELGDHNRGLRTKAAAVARGPSGAPIAEATLRFSDRTVAWNSRSVAGRA